MNIGDNLIPTENERKYVLKLDCEQQISTLAAESLHISQGYLIASRGMSLRLRKSVNKKTQYTMTLKCSTYNRVVEIEKKITERDFDDIWPHCLNKLEKNRHLVNDEKDQLWEVDFFKDYYEKTYFALAEFEMPEGQFTPYFVPSFIEENLVYEVGLTDPRFSSKLLADVRYAKFTYNFFKEN